MKKILVLFVCLFLIALPVFASGAKEGSKVKDGYTIGYIAFDMANIWNENSAKAFQYAAAQAPQKVKTVILDSRNSLEDSIAAVESLIQQQVDGISFYPISQEQAVQVIKLANAAKIPITVENIMMEPTGGIDFLAAVACEYDAIGYAAIKFIAETKPGAKVYYCAGVDGDGITDIYQKGVDKALAEYKDKVTIVSKRNADYKTELAYDVTTGLLASQTEFDYVFAQDGMMAKGVYQALKDAGKDNIPIVGTGGSPDDYQMLKDGVEAANMTAPVSIQGVQTFKNIYEFVVEGKRPTETKKSLPIIPVSGSKLDDFIAWSDYQAAYKYVYGK
jgi:ABC-type sugar transport system substrate-binding protein